MLSIWEANLSFLSLCTIRREKFGTVTFSSSTIGIICPYPPNLDYIQSFQSLALKPTSFGTTFDNPANSSPTPQFSFFAHALNHVCRFVVFAMFFNRNRIYKFSYYDKLHMWLEMPMYILTSSPTQVSPRSGFSLLSLSFSCTRTSS